MPIPNNTEMIVKYKFLTWRFSPRVIDEFKELEIPIPEGLTSFIQKVLSMDFLEEGITEYPMIDLDLILEKRGEDVSVRLLEESQ
jgi:hypothetical protein